MHNSHTLPITTCQPTAPHVITSQLPCRHLACGQLHMGPPGSLAVFLSPGVLPGPRKGSCSPSQTSVGPSSRDTCSQPTLPSTHLASSPERSPACGSLECGGLRGQQRRETARQFWAKMQEYMQVNLPGLGLCNRARGFLVCEFARSSVHMWVSVCVSACAHVCTCVPGFCTACVSPCASIPVCACACD